MEDFDTVSKDTFLEFVCMHAFKIMCSLEEVDDAVNSLIPTSDALKLGYSRAEIVDMLADKAKEYSDLKKDFSKNDDS